MIDGSSYRSRPATDDEPSPAGRALDDALAHVLGQLDHFQRCAVLTAPADPLDPQPTGRALLITLSPGTARIIGMSDLAHNVRLRLASGFLGWHTPPPPDTRTPLYQLREHLQPAQYNLLERNGFATVEELRDIPDDAWLELRGAGNAFLDAIRHALTEPRPDAEPEPAPTGWRLHVAPSGTTATVRAPGPIAITQLTDGTLHLARTDAPPTQATAAKTTNADGIWTTEIAEEILRNAQPAGSVFLRALIDAGGTATPEHLRNATGLTELRYATQSLTTNAARILTAHYDVNARRHRHFFIARGNPDRPRDKRVHDYHLPDDRLAAFEQALQRLGR